MRIAIAGYGQEGKASYKYWDRDGNKLTILDEREDVDNLPQNAHLKLGPGAFSDLAEYDLVIRSPSISPKRLSGAQKIWSATNEFFANCPAAVIGVTGTKGKGTTSSLIASILKAAGKTVHLVGNIGVPALEELPKIKPDDVVVFELSSFQLWDLEKGPHVAVVLAIEPDHLDVHENLADYIAAKANITRWQTVNDVLVFNKNNEISAQIASSSPAQKIEYPFPIDDYASSLQIPGAHNVENASAAIAAVREFVSDPDTIRAGLHAFTGLPHRLKFVREVDGVKYYDDSYSSAPSAAIAALASFKEPTIILLGGYEKGADFNELAMAAKTSSLKKAIIYGQTRVRIKKAFESAGIPQEKYTVYEDTSFADLVGFASAVAQSGDVVLLSPACASFDMFKNFTERGETFIKLVEGL
jgi:UDP-N-acetylmuramoylalanine--D-glutamate ligase